MIQYNIVQYSTIPDGVGGRAVVRPVEGEHPRVVDGVRLKARDEGVRGLAPHDDLAVLLLARFLGPRLDLVALEYNTVQYSIVQQYNSLNTIQYSTVQQYNSLNTVQYNNTIA